MLPACEPRLVSHSSTPEDGSSAAVRRLPWSSPAIIDQTGVALGTAMKFTDAVIDMHSASSNGTGTISSS